jgi:hypothetical protein
MVLVALISLAVGIFIGARYVGGPYYMRKLSEYEHQERRRRSGMNKRS